ncbi:hypothetical protein G4B88_029557 [Cannabis sativa]|uniref:Uncharacterized protein n=1 Tax=Cannabis sativa TaxID=3483 RepID=A0A7J6E8C8_CANSA|nr:hypothetical protein G4B88_029557 [Cannabis sativa]
METYLSILLHFIVMMKQEMLLSYPVLQTTYKMDENTDATTCIMHQVCLLARPKRPVCLEETLKSEEETMETSLQCCNCPFENALRFGSRWEVKLQDFSFVHPKDLVAVLQARNQLFFGNRAFSLEFGQFVKLVLRLPRKVGTKPVLTRTAQVSQWVEKNVCEEFHWDCKYGDTLQLLQLVFKLINFSQLIPIKPFNGLVHRLFDLVLVSRVINLLLHLLIFKLVLLCLLYQSLNLFLAQPSFVIGDSNLILHTSSLILTRNIKNTISIHIKTDIDLRNTSWSRRNAM